MIAEPAAVVVVAGRRARMYFSFLFKGGFKVGVIHD